MAGFSGKELLGGYQENVVCPLFTLKQLDKSRLVSGEVHYSNKGILPNLRGNPFVMDMTRVSNTASYFSEIQRHLNCWFAELFLRKLTDWANEDEYRWIYLDNDPKPIYVDFEDALEAIVIGENVADACLNDILQYCVKYHADVANLKWHNGFPKLEHLGQPYITHKHLLD